MIFTIFKGQERKAKKGQGNFMRGKVYIAVPEIDDPSVVDIERLEIVDEDGKAVWVNSSEGRFEFPSEVYAAVIQSWKKNVSKGQVVVIDEIGDKGDYYKVKDVGFVQAKNFQVLDMTVVRPGMVVFDLIKQRWSRILSVDESMRISVEGNFDMREASDFIFVVLDGDLSAIPLIRCKPDSILPNLTPNNLYRVKNVLENGDVVVTDDDKNEATFDSDVFTFA